MDIEWSMQDNNEMGREQEKTKNRKK